MRPASSVRFHGEASRFTASDPLRQTWGKVWRTLRGTSVRAGGVLQLSNGDESPEVLRQKERHESVGGVEYANDGQVADSKVYTAALGYEYSLSKRTLVYTGLGYTKRELEANYKGVIGNWEEEGYDFALGLVHKF